jgi:hypothetical protein
MAAQHFFLGQAYLGHRMIPDLRVVPGLEVRRHYSQVYFCMRCGEIWGRMIHDKAELTQNFNRPCLEHGGGNFSTPFPWPETCLDFADDWPAAAIAHEFKVELRLAERALNQLESS